jgi:hypothetical protein
VKKVVLCTPIKNGVDSNYLKHLIPIIRQELPGVEIEVLFLEGPSINFARNAMVYEVRRAYPDATDLVFLDDDIANWDEKALLRLLSHDVDVVAGSYCKRKPGIPQWLFVPKPGADVREDGVLECTAVATGFLRIRMPVFTKIAEMTPEHAFLAKDSPESGVSLRHDWFRMGVVGPDTAESKLEEIRKLYETDMAEDEVVLGRIGEVLDRKPQPGRLLGEDYFLCRSARKAGFRVFVDLGLPILGHIGKTAFPITHDQVGCGANREFEMPTPEDF